MEKDDIDDLIEDLLEKILEDKDFRAEADNIFRYQKYPDHSIKFVQSAVYDECPERFALPDEEIKILDLLERIQNPSNGVVMFWKGTLANALHMTDVQKRRMQDSLDHLVETGFLTCIYKPAKGSNKYPGVYKINPSVTAIGKLTGTSSEKAKINIPGFVNNFRQAKFSVFLQDGTQVIGGMLVERIPEAKNISEKKSKKKKTEKKAENK